MPGNGPVRTIPAKAAAIPLAALLALNPDDGAQPGSGMEQSPALLREAPAAVFPADENSPVPSFFAAETSFDSEAGEDALDWLASED